jgi:hypothetical protein
MAKKGVNKKIDPRRTRRGAKISAAEAAEKFALIRDNWFLNLRNLWLKDLAQP